jgi:hypothetical protein
MLTSLICSHEGRIYPHDDWDGVDAQHVTDVTTGRYVRYMRAESIPTMTVYVCMCVICVSVYVYIVLYVTP